MFGSRLPQYSPIEITIGGFIMFLFLLVCRLIQLELESIHHLILLQN